MNTCCKLCYHDVEEGIVFAPNDCIGCPCHQNPPTPEWVEKFDKEFNWGIASLTNSNKQNPTSIRDVAVIKAFIQSEVVEKMIERIPDMFDHPNADDGIYDLEPLKQQLRAEFLGREEV